MSKIPLTLAQTRDLQSLALLKLIQQAGNPAHLARMLQIPDTTVHGWLARKKISSNGVKLVVDCLAFDISAEELRPDLFA
jgi:DNA-binding transcriptional regulator YdaS (Cro superfamily)